METRHVQKETAYQSCFCRSKRKLSPHLNRPQKKSRIEDATFHTVYYTASLGHLSRVQVRGKQAHPEATKKHHVLKNKRQVKLVAQLVNWKFQLSILTFWQYSAGLAGLFPLLGASNTLLSSSRAMEKRSILRRPVKESSFSTSGGRYSLELSLLSSRSEFNISSPTLRGMPGASGGPGADTPSTLGSSNLLSRGWKSLQRLPPGQHSLLWYSLDSHFCLRRFREPFCIGNMDGSRLSCNIKSVFCQRCGQVCEAFSKHLECQLLGLVLQYRNPALLCNVWLLTLQRLPVNLELDYGEDWFDSHGHLKVETKTKTKCFSPLSFSIKSPTNYLLCKTQTTFIHCLVHSEKKQFSKSNMKLKGS